MALPINIDDLINRRVVESARVESQEKLECRAHRPFHLCLRQ